MAYWEVFLDRFCDHIYMSITYYMMTNLSKQLNVIFDMSSLAKSQDEILKMMEEDKSVTQK